MNPAAACRWPSGQVCPSPWPPAHRQSGADHLDAAWVETIDARPPRPSSWCRPGHHPQRAVALGGVVRGCRCSLACWVGRPMVPRPPPPITGWPRSSAPDFVGQVTLTDPGGRSDAQPDLPNRDCMRMLARCSSRVLRQRPVDGLREGVEAALIVAIILAYPRTGNARYFGRILGSAAVVLSVGIGVGLFATIGGWKSRTSSSKALLVATAVDWMLFDATAGRVGAGELHAAVDRALTSRAWARPRWPSRRSSARASRRRFLSGTATSPTKGTVGRIRCPGRPGWRS